MTSFSDLLSKIDTIVWGPAMLILLVGTGIFLTIRTHFLSWRMLPYALKITLESKSRKSNAGKGDISPFSSLTTSLAATIGTGNIVGVATAMVAGGPGALVWIWISAAFGLTTKFAECMLAVKYREVNDLGEMVGGPMVTIKRTFRNKKIGAALGWLFAFFAVIASFGIGNMTQGNSISTALAITFSIPKELTGVIICILALVIIVGGIKKISKFTQVIVPFMAIFYMCMGLIVIIGNIANLPEGIYMIFHMAFSPKAVGGGLCGSISVSMISALRFGVARGCFSNEAGLGSAAITAAAASTDNHIRQGYINMTGTFWDTLVICTITGLCIACSGALGRTDPATSELMTGVSLTMSAFESVLGEFGRYIVCIGITLFAFSTILGWEYYGEKAFEYLVKSPQYNMMYRIVFSLIVYVGATCALTVVWNFSDIANALMAIPNLICLLYLSKEVAKDMRGL